MFTGIIEEIGIVKDFTQNQNGAVITVSCKDVLKDTKVGESIAINGTCQTVVKMSENSFTADVSNETLKVTTFSALKSGVKVNLERALTLNERIGGHLVSGHVDSVAKLISSKKESEFYSMKFEITNDASRYVVKKGSITINGISLTVAEIQGNIVEVAVIPHTYENTNLSELKTGDIVNIETDVFAKYIEKFLLNEKTKSIISEDFLKENGFM